MHLPASFLHYFYNFASKLSYCMYSRSVFLKSTLAIIKYILHSIKGEICLCTNFAKHFESVSNNEIGR